MEPLITPYREFVGKTLEETTKILERQKRDFRILEYDGIACMITDDIEPLRVNLIVQKGIVTGVRLF